MNEKINHYLMGVSVKEQLENLKKAIKAEEKSISILKKCKTPAKARIGLEKIAEIMSTISGREKLVDSLRSIQYYNDFQIIELRDTILSVFPKNIITYKDSIKKLKAYKEQFAIIKIPKKKILVVACIIFVIVIVIFFPWTSLNPLQIKIHAPPSPVACHWSDNQWSEEPFEYIIEVNNNGREDLFNVSIYDNEGFSWTGTLKAGENKNLTVIYNGSIRESLVITAHVTGWNINGDMISNSDEITLEMYGGTYNLIYAAQEGLISFELRGMGYCSGDSIKLTVSLNVNLSIKINLDTALILINSGSGQNMIISDQRILTIEPDVDYEFDIKAYCLDLHLSNPSSAETFTILNESDSYSEDVITLVNHLNDLPSSEKRIKGVQLAVWVITDDIATNEIPFDYSQPDIDNAKELLEGAGINIAGKKLFQ